jgi:predicted DNA-binding transcriptional regulator YafY
MSNERNRIVINRLMQLAVVLHEARFGLTVDQLEKRLERSRSTVYRDLKSLREIGFGPEVETRNGEARYRLPRFPIAAIAPTRLQLAALCLAREALDSFSGTAAVEQLDQLLSQWGSFPKAQLTLALHRRSKGQHQLVGTLDGAIAKRRRVTIEYQGQRDRDSKPRKVEPIALRASGEQLYLFAYDVERNGYRTFKTARMQKASMLAEASNDHSQVDLQRQFAHAVKTWTAESPTMVVVRLSAEKARFASEYPLISNQRLRRLADGSVEVTADVNGVTEALNWVLSWGAHAEAVSPPELRAKAAEELRIAAARYGDGTNGPKPVKKARVISADSGRADQGGARRASAGSARASGMVARATKAGK